jgi:hypothetical protein
MRDMTPVLPRRGEGAAPRALRIADGETRRQKAPFVARFASRRFPRLAGERLR